MARDNSSGVWGEAVAARYLRRRFYRILSTNFRCRLGEIDLIAARGSWLIFVEVKTRRDDSFGTAGEFVTSAKQRRLIAAAELYLARHETDRQPRFDVMEVYAPNGTNTRRPKINHIKDAFQVGNYR